MRGRRVIARDARGVLNVATGGGEKMGAWHAEGSRLTSLVRWEEGADPESLSYVPIEFEPPGSEHKRKGLARASESLIRKIEKIGIRELVRLGLGRRILEQIIRRELVNAETLREYESRIRAQTRR
jgi:hypothetical protein